MIDIMDYVCGVLCVQLFSMLLGMELMYIGDNEVLLCLFVCEELWQQYGFVYGGVISYFVDNVLMFVGVFVFGLCVIIVEYKINYLWLVVNGMFVVCVKFVYVGWYQVICQCYVFVIDGDYEWFVVIV